MGLLSFLNLLTEPIFDKFFKLPENIEPPVWIPPKALHLPSGFLTYLWVIGASVKPYTFRKPFIESSINLWSPNHPNKDSKKFYLYLNYKISFLTDLLWLWQRSLGCLFHYNTYITILQHNNVSYRPKSAYTSSRSGRWAGEVPNGNGFSSTLFGCAHTAMTF